VKGGHIYQGKEKSALLLLRRHLVHANTANGPGSCPRKVNPSEDQVPLAIKVRQAEVFNDIAWVAIRWYHGACIGVGRRQRVRCEYWYSHAGRRSTESVEDILLGFLVVHHLRPTTATEATACREVDRVREIEHCVCQCGRPARLVSALQGPLNCQFTISGELYDTLSQLA
jgi:hypothetical protein